MYPSWNCLKLLHDFIGCQTLLAWFWEFHGKSLMLKYFPDAMLFLQVFIRISVQFGGFSEQHQGSSRKIPREIFHVSAGKTSNFMSADANIWCKQNFYVCKCGKQIRITEILFGVKIFFCMKTVGIGNIYHLSS